MAEEFTPAQTRGYTARKVAETQAKSAETVATIHALGDMGVEAMGLLKELIRVGVSNPVCGAAGAIIVADVLQRAGVISSNAEALIDGIAVAVVGVSLAISAAGAAASVIDSLDPFDMFKGNTQPPNDLSPSAQVVVFGDEAGARVARALSAQLPAAARYVEGRGE